MPDRDPFIFGSLNIVGFDDMSIIRLRNNLAPKDDHRRKGTSAIEEVSRLTR